jgi:hypothetical protein
MSADIVKESVFDDRIIQHRPRYAVEKGALSLTNAPFSAIAATSSQMTFNVYVPSENVFVDRALRWSASGYFSMTITAPTSGPGIVLPLAGDVVVAPGRDFSLSPFPLNGLCQTMTATINDTTAVINTQDVLFEVLRLTDYKKNLLQRTCPTMLDKYQANYLGAGAVNSPIGGWDSAVNDDVVPNGAFTGLFFTTSTGVKLENTSGVSGQGWSWGPNGIPVWTANATSGQQLTLYFGFTSTEKLVLSPFVFADDQECDTGLFGINNIQLVMNFLSSPARVIKTLGDLGYNTAISNVAYNQSQYGTWQNPVLNVQFLTPSLDVPLPPKSVVPYMEFPRYITQQQNGQLSAFGTQGYINQLQSQTITLPQIPDLLIIYVKAVQQGGNPDPTGNDYGNAYLPLASIYNSQIKNPLSVNFDNFSGLLSSHTTEELYQMSIANGLEMSWNEWSGLAAGPAVLPSLVLGDTAHPGYVAGARRPTTGGFLVLKPSKDITLQPGQAPSLVGNFTLQFNLQVVNTYPFTVQPTLYVITANSGFFESIRGSSRIIKGVLSEQDIISAPMSASQTHDGLKRLVGGRISFGSLANVFHKARDIYNATKPAISALKPHLGKAGEMLGKVGYGDECGGATGAGTGGATGAGRRKLGLSARLM